MRGRCRGRAVAVYPLEARAGRQLELLLFAAVGDLDHGDQLPLRRRRLEDGRDRGQCRLVAA
jgi:hypothetical protein